MYINKLLRKLKKHTPLPKINLEQTYLFSETRTKKIVFTEDYT
jgi:hypothetical protein